MVSTLSRSSLFRAAMHDHVVRPKGNDLVVQVASWHALHDGKPESGDKEGNIVCTHVGAPTIYYQLNLPDEDAATYCLTYS